MLGRCLAFLRLASRAVTVTSHTCTLTTSCVVGRVPKRSLEPRFVGWLGWPKGLRWYQRCGRGRCCRDAASRLRTGLHAAEPSGNPAELEVSLTG